MSITSAEICFEPLTAEQDILNPLVKRLLYLILTDFLFCLSIKLYFFYVSYVEIFC